MINKKTLMYHYHLRVLNHISIKVVVQDRLLPHPIITCCSAEGIRQLIVQQAQ